MAAADLVGHQGAHVEPRRSPHLHAARIRLGMVDQRLTALSARRRQQEVMEHVKRDVAASVTIRDGLAILHAGAGPPVLFMPYPHALNVIGDATPTALIEGLSALDRHIITFDP